MLVHSGSHSVIRIFVDDDLVILDNVTRATNEMPVIYAKFRIEDVWDMLKRDLNVRNLNTPNPGIKRRILEARAADLLPIVLKGIL